MGLEGEVGWSKFAFFCLLVSNLSRQIQPTTCFRTVS